jgi:hypothetical protein
LCLPALGNSLPFLTELLALFTDSVGLYPAIIYSYSLIRTQGMWLVRKSLYSEVYGTLIPKIKSRSYAVHMVPTDAG